MRMKQPFYIIQHSDIKSKLLCSVEISLRCILIIHGDVKYRKSIEKYSVSEFLAVPILRVLSIGFVPSLVNSHFMSEVIIDYTGEINISKCNVTSSPIMDYC